MSKSQIEISLNSKKIVAGRMDPRVKRVIKAANDLSYGHSQNIGFLHSVMCQTFLPCQQPPVQLRKWKKTNGHTSMLIEAGSVFDQTQDKWRELPLPSGSKARLALIHLSTTAIRRQSPIIKLDGSMTNFLTSMLNRRPSSLDIRQFKLQMTALGSATIRMANDNRHSNSHIVSEFDSMWLKKEGQRILWPSQFQLSVEYWNSLKHKAVPIDLKAISAICHSTLAIDIYLWLTHRLRRLSSPYTIYWSVLWKQFGSGYGRIRDFRRKFLKALITATAVYPKAIIEEAFSETGISMGLKLYNSPPPVPLRY